MKHSALWHFRAGPGNQSLLMTACPSLEDTGLRAPHHSTGQTLQSLSTPVTERVWDPAARPPKASKQGRLVERKVCFILGARNWTGAGQTSIRRPTPPLHWQTVGKSFCRQKWGGGQATRRNSTVSSDGHLQLGHRWSDRRHLACFRYT